MAFWDTFEKIIQDKNNQIDIYNAFKFIVTKISKNSNFTKMTEVFYNNSTCWKLLLDSIIAINQSEESLLDDKKIIWLNYIYENYDQFNNSTKIYEILDVYLRAALIEKSENIIDIIYKIVVEKFDFTKDAYYLGYIIPLILSCEKYSKPIKKKLFDSWENGKGDWRALPLNLIQKISAISKIDKDFISEIFQKTYGCIKLNSDVLQIEKENELCSNLFSSYFFERILDTYLVSAQIDAANTILDCINYQILKNEFKNVSEAIANKKVQFINILDCTVINTSLNRTWDKSKYYKKLLDSIFKHLQTQNSETKKQILNIFKSNYYSIIIFNEFISFITKNIDIFENIANNIIERHTNLITNYYTFENILQLIISIAQKNNKKLPEIIERNILNLAQQHVSNADNFISYVIYNIGNKNIEFNSEKAKKIYKQMREEQEEYYKKNYQQAPLNIDTATDIDIISERLSDFENRLYNKLPSVEDINEVWDDIIKLYEYKKKSKSQIFILYKTLEIISRNILKNNEHYNIFINIINDVFSNNGDNFDETNKLTFVSIERYIAEQYLNFREPHFYAIKIYINLYKSTFDDELYKKIRRIIQDSYDSSIIFGAISSIFSLKLFNKTILPILEDIFNVIRQKFNSILLLKQELYCNCLSFILYKEVSDFMLNMVKEIETTETSYEILIGKYPRQVLSLLLNLAIIYNNEYSKIKVYELVNNIDIDVDGEDNNRICSDIVFYTVPFIENSYEEAERNRGIKILKEVFQKLYASKNKDYTIDCIHMMFLKINYNLSYERFIVYASLIERALSYIKDNIKLDKALETTSLFVELMHNIKFDNDSYFQNKFLDYLYIISDFDFSKTEDNEFEFPTIIANIAQFIQDLKNVVKDKESIRKIKAILNKMANTGHPAILRLIYTLSERDNND